MSKESTAARKNRHLAARGKLMSRRDEDVSENCRKARYKRERMRAWLKADKKTRGPSPSERGMRQFTTHRNAISQPIAMEAVES